LDQARTEAVAEIEAAIKEIGGDLKMVKSTGKTIREVA
jgi:hypothetical protein